MEIEVLEQRQNELLNMVDALAEKKIKKLPGINKDKGLKSKIYINEINV